MSYWQFFLLQYISNNCYYFDISILHIHKLQICDSKKIAKSIFLNKKSNRLSYWSIKVSQILKLILKKNVWNISEYWTKSKKKSIFLCKSKCIQQTNYRIFALKIMVKNLQVALTTGIKPISTLILINILQASLII